MAYGLIHIPSGERVYLGSIEYGYSCRGIWKSKHSTRWALIQAVNEYAEMLEDMSPAELAHYNYDNPITGRANAITLNEFMVIKLPKEVTE